MLKFHHSTSVDAVVYGTLKPNREYADEDFVKVYSWLEKQIGFYPLFLAVGETEDDMRMTGYQNQFGRISVHGQNGNEYFKKGEFLNGVMFSYENLDGVFTDYDSWCFVLQLGINGSKINDDLEKELFKKSYTKSDWIKKAKQEPHTVQLLMPELYLPNADRIWVRNQKTQKQLTSMGFKNVKTKRLKVDE